MPRSEGYMATYHRERRRLNPELRERDRRLSLEAKRRRTGHCIDCGAETRYNGHTTNGPSERCQACAAKANGQARIGTGPTERRLLEFIAGGERRFTEISEHLGISKAHAAGLLNRCVGHGLIVRLRRGWYTLP